MAIVLANNEGRPGMPVAVEALREGSPVLDVLEAAVAAVEADLSVRTVGRGGYPNLLGEVELDASIMDGQTLRTGSVGALKGFAHPIRVARQVMEALPHELLVGEGAARFAAEVGAERTDLLTEERAVAWRDWLARNVPADARARWPDVALAPLARLTSFPRTARDTVVFLVRDDAGNIASATSTSGWPYKYPGRLGDSPIVGAGHYAHRRFGAAACTHTGEMTLRAGTARALVLYLKTGMDLGAACCEAVDDLGELVGGYLDDVSVHAIDARGRHCVLSTGRRTEYWIWESGMAAPEARPAPIRHPPGWSAAGPPA